MFFKEHNIKLALSIDGPMDITDFLRGKGSYAKVMQGFDMVKKMNYNNVECLATYTGYHERLKYTYDDIDDYFKGLGVRATISRVLSNEREMLPINCSTEKQIKDNIWESARKVYNNQQTGGINPYLYRTLMSLSFGARSINYCDDLFSDFSVTYDYDGTKYNCFHFWGEKEYAVRENEVCNAHIQEVNCKDNNKVCALCWAKYLCKICTAAVMQNTMEWPVMDNGECKDRNILQLCIECIIEYQQDEKVTQLMDNFVHNFINYQ
ncbi:MAG: hypothetical protein RSD97_08880 [Lachnospiraceae bacterium]